jgi:hypothetical protein
MVLVVDVKRRKALDLHIFLIPVYIILTHRIRQVIVGAEETDFMNDREVTVLVIFSNAYDAIWVSISCSGAAFCFFLLLLLNERVGLHGYYKSYARNPIHFKTNFDAPNQ